MTTPEWAPLAILAILLVCCGVGLGVLAVRLQALSRRVQGLEQSTRRIIEHIRGFSAGAVGQGQHVQRLEQDMSRLRERMERVAASESGGDGSFNQAIRMAQKGVSAQEIMDTCGLSQMEADLVVLLHRGQ